MARPGFGKLPVGSSRKRCISWTGIILSEHLWAAAKALHGEGPPRPHAWRRGLAVQTPEHRWTRAGAQGVLHLCLDRINGRWDQRCCKLTRQPYPDLRKVA